MDLIQNIVILANGHTIFSTIEYNNGTKPSYILDGMTSDINGNLYIAVNGGKKIFKFNPKYIRFSYFRLFEKKRHNKIFV